MRNEPPSGGSFRSGSFGVDAKRAERLTAIRADYTAGIDSRDITA